MGIRISLSLSLGLSGEEKKSMSMPPFMPLQGEKRSQISSSGTCVETQLFRPACWHLLSSASSIYALMISPRTFQVARPLCNVWSTACSHAITPAVVLSRCKIQTPDDLSVTLLLLAAKGSPGVAHEKPFGSDKKKKNSCQHTLPHS